MSKVILKTKFGTASTSVVLVSIVLITIWLLRRSTTGDLSSLTVRGRGGEVTALAFAPDELTLAIASTRVADISTWDILRHSEKDSLKTPGVASELVFTPSNGLVAWNPAWEDTVQSWGAGGHLESIFRPFKKQFCGLAYCPGSRSFAMAFEVHEHQISRIIMEDATNGSERFSQDIPGRITTPMAITPDGRFLAVGTMMPDSSDPTFVGADVFVWDMRRGVAPSRFRIRGGPDRLELSGDGRFLAAWWMNESMNIEIWDVEICHVKAILHATIKARMSDVRFSPDGRTLGVGAGDRTASIVPFLRSLDRDYGEVRLWDLPTATNIETLVIRHPVTRIAFSSDGRSLAAGCDDGTVKVWINALRR